MKAAAIRELLVQPYRLVYMGNEKLKIARTDAGNLVGNLRGEVDEVITPWLLMRHFMGQAARLASGDLDKDIANRDLLFLNLLVDKLRTN